ncbi:MAG: hypothetical protein LW838_13880, partial [Nitrosomonadaceae bacterium]|nr:hypothetical protein [Nitrosomonadaceae bacterium]
QTVCYPFEIPLCPPSTQRPELPPLLRWPDGLAARVVDAIGGDHVVAQEREHLAGFEQKHASMQAQLAKLG